MLARAATGEASISLEEVNDVCLLLMLAKRVSVPGFGCEHSAARWLSCLLQDLGIPVELLDRTLKYASGRPTPSSRSCHPGEGAVRAGASYAWTRWRAISPAGSIASPHDASCSPASDPPGPNPHTTLLYSVRHLAGVKSVNPAYEILGDPAVALDDLEVPAARLQSAPITRVAPDAGVEETTGSLGTGAATSVSMAIVARWQAATFNRPDTSCSTTTSTPSPAAAA